jgi:hypothetical protein
MALWRRWRTCGCRCFEFNGGQSAPEVMFTARGQGYGLFLTATGAVLALPAAAAHENARALPAVVRMTFAGANPAPVVSGVDELPGKVHYFRGRDLKTWQANISTYARVRYRDLYPSVNLVYYGNDEQQLEYDLLVEPGGNPKDIVLRFDGVDGLDSGNAIAVNWRGHAHVAGVTASGDFPTFRPFQSTTLRGTSEAFVTKLSRDGSSLVYSSNLVAIASTMRSTSSSTCWIECRLSA